MLPEYFINNVNCLTSVNIYGETVIDNSLNVSGSLMVGQSSVNAAILYVKEKVGINTETPNVELTVNGSISSNNIIYDKVGNSTEWNSVYTSYNQNSATYATQNYVQNNFLALTGGTVTGDTQFNKNVTIWGVLSATGGTYFANTIYSTTSALSVVHVGSGTALYVGSKGTGDIASFYDLDDNVEMLHIGGHDGDYPNVGVKTSTPNVDFTVNGEISSSEIIYDASGNSTQWNSVYSIVQQKSATEWDNSIFSINYLPLSGGTMTGKLNLFPSTISSVPINLGSGVIPSNTVAGDLFASGNNIWFKGTSGGPYIFAYKNDTNTFYLPQIISTVSPTGDAIPALRITQAGGGEALRIEDETNPDSTPFIVNSDGSVGIGLSSLIGIDAKLTVIGNISATGNVYGSNLNVSNWNSVYTNVNNNSAKYADINFVQNNFLPLSGGTITGNLYVLSSLEVGYGNTVLYTSDDKVGINTKTPNKELTIIGSISATQTIYTNQIYGTIIDWMTLTRGYKTEPTLNSSIGTGDVYTYVYSTSSTDKTYYRYIATDGSEDSYYENFSGGILSNLIAKKQITL